MIASVNYFKRRVAQDDYAKSISFIRVKHRVPEKQPVFPLKYYAPANFKSFLSLFGEREDLEMVAVFCYFAGLRIFEAVKLRKKDIRLMDNKAGYLVSVLGKGDKRRTTYILDKHVVKYIKEYLEQQD